MSTPLEKLDDAVHEYLESLDLQEGTFVRAWAVGIETGRIQTEMPEALPLADGMQYAFGPQTSIVQVSGLAKFLQTLAENRMYYALNHSDETDD